MRAMMSLPPPAAKPTMIWIGRAGYFAGYSPAKAGLPTSATSPRQAPISRARPGMVIDPFSEPRDMNMQDGRFAVIKRGERPIDRGRQRVGLAHALAVGAERLCHFGKITPLALPARHQSRLELVGLGGNTLGVDPLGGGFHRLP